ncbi:hypothetical protein SUGI_0092900 [Cryptomeria japonica]|nr:hypothetical protein SUGI_0092900 [Cryptomeria japonica]
MDVTSLQTPLIEHTNEYASFVQKFWLESNKLWRIAGPAILYRLAMYGLTVITQEFAGQIGDLELAAISMIINVIWGFNYGLSLGLGSALQTLCGQAFGAQRYSMLGVYLQRSWIVVTSFAVIFLPVYIFASPILKLLGQADDIAELTGKVAIWCIPMHFSLVLWWTTTWYLQAQLKNMVIAYTITVTLTLHVLMSWVFTVKLGWGLPGAVASMNLAWCFPSVTLFLYIICGGCPLTWKGFSLDAFSQLWSYLKLSVASGIMLCVELWYTRLILLLTFKLQNLEVADDSLSICMTINGWEFMIPIAFLVGTSVRVSNELGAGNSKAARFSAVVSATTSLLIGIVIFFLIIIFRNSFDSLFTQSASIQQAVSKLALLLAFTILLNSVQPVLSGVAIGTGKQHIIAYVNVISYFVIGVPLGIILGYSFHLEAQGIWMGMLCGTAVQTAAIMFIVFRTDWNRETTIATNRVKRWSSSYCEWEEQP